MLEPCRHRKTTASLSARLQDYQAQRRYRYRRARSSQASGIVCHSNDYLGLSQHPAVLQALQKTAQYYGVGSGAAALVSGYTQVHQDCEQAFATFLQRDRALLFGNGYLANLGVLDALAQRGDYIYQDRHNHASLLDAGRLSRAISQRYAHADIQDLNRRLASAPAGSQRFIVSDGVFSMCGDATPLPALVQAAQAGSSNLVIDDAHGIGVLGASGRGTVEVHQASQDDVPVLVCPLGKALGVYGAMVAGSDTTIESLIQFARSYMYTTALPPALAAAALSSLAVLQKESWRREQLQEWIVYFKAEAIQQGVDVHLIPSNTAIQSFRIGTAERALAVSQQLETQGFLTQAMRPPSVPTQQALLRVTLNVSHTKEQLQTLLRLIKVALQDHS